MQCYNCKEEVEPKKGRGGCMELLVIIIGIITIPLGLLIIVAYYSMTKKWVCPVCDNKLNK